MHTIYRTAACAAIAGLCLIPTVVFSEEGTPAMPAGTLEATISHDEQAGTWTLHANGSYSGDAAEITGMFVFESDTSGAVLRKDYIAHGGSAPLIPRSSPFTISAAIGQPGIDWAYAGFGFDVEDLHGNSAQVASPPFPIIWQNPVLIDHAWNGSAAPAPNYAPGDIPSGIGIPHAIINTVPAGTYYAVVFFSNPGCPSGNYQINAFIPGTAWGYDIAGNNGVSSHAFSSQGGGCMQEFYVDPAKASGWLWGALSNTGTSTAIADPDGVPAFALCGTRAACDAISPHPKEASSTQETPSQGAVSSVLFLPGIKGSNLYTENPFCIVANDDCSIPLWLPLADVAVPELFMDAEGKSRRNLFAKEGRLLEAAFGQHFYDRFAGMMDAAQASGSFGSSWSWKPVAYDWRMSLPDILDGGAQHGTRIYYGEATDTPYIEQSLRLLASSSPTGKVTIVAHSNGGLVAKALLQRLGDALSAQLVDSLILVGVPQSGAPRALGALLYGDAEGIPGIRGIPDALMSAAHAREFGLNSPMAYHLLPSARYMDADIPEHPLVAFEDSPLFQKESAAYGSSIDSADELRRFALAEEGGRLPPAAEDLGSAAVLNPRLLAYAKDEHAAIDAWNPPPGIEVYEIGGYGVSTISGIDLYSVQKRDGTRARSYRPLFTQDGDGTVPVISALMMNASGHVHAIWAGLASTGAQGASYDHGNMLNAPELQNVLISILHKTFLAAETAHAGSTPPEEDRRRNFAFFVHSPVSLSIRDGDGNETHVVGDDVREDIPGSTAGTFGEVKYALVPILSSADAPYAITLRGEATGAFTLDMQELDGDAVAASTTIADVPTINGASATLTVRNSLSEASPMEVDADGDGTTDYEIIPQLGGTAFPPETPLKRHSSAGFVRSVAATLREPLSYATRIFLQGTSPAASTSVRAASAAEARPAVSSSSAVTPLASSARVEPVRHPPQSHSLAARMLRYILEMLKWLFALRTIAL